MQYSAERANPLEAEGFVWTNMPGPLNQEPEVCNVLGDAITLRLTTEQTDGKYSVAEFATPGGVGQPPHTHAWDETYLVLEGELNLNINGETTVVGMGGCYQVKAGVVHAPTPNGDFCRYVMVGQPGGVESVFKSLKANEKDLNDMAKVVEIVTKEGVNIAG
ncbi:cupin domain-containing protein [Synechococcus sp. A10-1-5-9]|uniref:cupin domain-containing protein n=1 Tax=Synechococcus sp. A10-1-5-9 TaxID=3392295 RepID=UPI0039E908CD